MRITQEERKTIERIFANKWAETIYGGNIHSSIKECEQIKDMTEEKQRRRYPTAFYWFDKWKEEQE